MGLFANPLSYAGYPPNVTGTPQTQNSTVRAATAAEAAAGTANNVYISPATESSSVALDFASPPVLGFGSTTPRPVHATTFDATTPVPVTSGGTGVATVDAFALVCGGTTDTGALQTVAGGASGTVLQGAGDALPVYSTATYPATATGTGTLLRADGTNWSASTSTYPNTNAINTLLYASAANTMSALATANNGVLSTGTTGVPAITALGQGQTLVGKGAASAPAATSFTNAQITYVPSINSIPLMSLSTGGAAVVTINNTNLWSFPQWGAYFEAYNTVALQAIAPALSTTAGRGLNIDAATGANAAAMEITEGNSVNTKNAFVIGTSPAFYVKAQFNIATLNTIADVFVGFRKQQSYQATVPTGYTDYAVIGAHSTAGEIELQTQIGSGGNVLTDTTNAATAATTFTLEVDVSSGGVVTYKFNGSPPTVVAAYTFTNGLTVIPWIYFKSAAGAHGEMDLVSYSCGLQ